MKSHKAAKRYAKAFFQMAQEANKLEKVYHDIQLILHVAGHSKDFTSILRDPTIPQEKLQSILTEIFKAHVDSVTLSFLLFFCQRKRINCLPQICTVFEKLYFDFQKILKVRLTSLLHFSKHQLEIFQEKLERHFKKAVQITQEIDQSLLGGFKVQIDDLIYDYSIKTQIDQFRTAVLNA